MRFPLAILLACAGFPSHGQTQADPQPGARSRDRGEIEEVIVTARRVEESLQDAPVSVTAFTPENLEQIGVSQPKDIAQYAPNVTIRNQPGTNNDYAVSIRGVAGADPALAFDPAAGLYIDGVYIARHAGMAFDIVDLKRIEVLRGPQGTLFGRNTIGGAINVITERPRGAFAYKISGAGGDEDYEQGKVTVDTPTVGDWAAKFSYLFNDREGEKKSLYDGNLLGGQTFRAYRLALRWTPPQSWTGDYSYTRTEGSGNGNNFQLTHMRPIYADPDGQFYGGPYYERADQFDSPDRLSQLPVIGTDPGLNDLTIDGHALHLEWSATPQLTIKLITAYRDFADSSTTDIQTVRVPNDGDVLDGRRLETEGSLSPVSAGTFVSLFSAPRIRAQDQLTQELQFIGSLFDGSMHFTSGLYYFEEDGEESNPQEFVLPTSVVADFAASGAGLPAGLADAVSDVVATEGTANAIWLFRPFRYTIDNKAYAAYSNVTWNLFTDFEITVGARYTVDERATSLHNIFDGSPQTFSEDNEWSNFSPGITFRYRWSPAVSTYLKATTGYRSGGFNVRGTTENSFRIPFDPETLTSYELGFKTDLLDRTLRLNGAVFHFIYEDRQIAQFEAGSGGASSKIVNAGKSTTTGLELDAILLPWPGGKIIAGYGYMDVQYKKFVTGPVDPVTGFPTGPNRDISDEASTERYAPENTASLALQHSFSPWDVGRLTLRIAGTYTDRITFHPQLNLFDSSSAHAELNTRATLSQIPLWGGNLSIAAWGKNLTNEVYRDFGIDFGLLGFTTNQHAPLRSWGIDLTYTFNR